ncbi:MAG: DUF4919 domain-containing protein [Planctomycetota bacterium]
MREQLIEFIQSPSRDSYLAIRREIIGSDVYEPYSDEINTASELYTQEKVEQARKTIQNGMPNLMLSPRAHRFLGFLHHKLGDSHAAQVEMMIGDACVEGILSSGDGSQERPFIVTRTSDEHEVIEHLGKQLKQQSLTHDAGLHLDLLECTDNTEYWFDITDAYNQLAKSFGE